MSALLMCSCSQKTPVIGKGNKPFIVKKIKMMNNSSFSIYYGYNGSGVEFSGMGSSALALPTGMFNIGDTILPKDFIK